MVQSCQCVSLAPAELRDKAKDRGGILGFAGETPENEAQVFRQSACKAGPVKELLGIEIVLRCGARCHLFEGNGKLVWIERAAFADFRSWRRYLVPRFHLLFLGPFAHAGSNFDGFSEVSTPSLPKDSRGVGIR